MKAHIVTEKLSPLVLSFGFSGKKDSLLKEVLKELALPEREIAFEEVGQSVGFLAGYRGYDKKETGSAAAPMQTECLIFSGFSDGQLERMLSTLRKKGLYVPLKATVTATNQRWSFTELLLHLNEERQAIAARQKD